jgi:hypothetical protein
MQRVPRPRGRFCSHAGPRLGLGDALPVGVVADRGHVRGDPIRVEHAVLFVGGVVLVDGAQLRRAERRRIGDGPGRAASSRVGLGHAVADRVIPVGGDPGVWIRHRCEPALGVVAVQGLVAQGVDRVRDRPVWVVVGAGHRSVCLRGCHRFLGRVKGRVGDVPGSVGGRHQVLVGVVAVGGDVTVWIGHRQDLPKRIVCGRRAPERWRGARESQRRGRPSRLLSPRGKLREPPALHRIIPVEGFVRLGDSWMLDVVRCRWGRRRRLIAGGPVVGVGPGVPVGVDLRGYVLGMPVGVVVGDGGHHRSGPVEHGASGTVQQRC